MINPQWLELPMSRMNFHGPKDVRAIEVRLYKVLTVKLLKQGYLRKIGSGISTSLNQGYNFRNSRFQLYEFTILISRIQLQEFTNSTSRTHLREFKLTNLTSRIHVFNVTNSTMNS